MRIEDVHDPADPRVAEYRNLKDPELRLRRGLFVAESRAVVRELLASSRFRTRSVLVTRAALDDVGDALSAAAPDLPVFLADNECARSLTGFNFHRGCAALGERGPAPEAGALVDPPGPRLVLVLDEVSNPDNVGGVFRNARAFGADAVLLSAGSADPLYRKTIRVSMGASLAIPFAPLTDWAAGLVRLRAAGYVVAALTPEPAALDIARLGASHPAPPRVALVLGAEGPGLRPETRAAADLALRIAMAPGVDSLNVATAAAIALHRLHLQSGSGLQSRSGG